MQEITFVGISRLVQISSPSLEFQQSVLGELRGSLNEPSALPHIPVLLVQFSHLIDIIIQEKNVHIKILKYSWKLECAHVFDTK